ncbi:MAG: GNAT family N-acetyltransferase [Candidatus Wallbacteria bacterium]|nr:GNAT family N-acetyltransferase [Candidatus Wallbacteria bacterium]
MDVLGSGLYEDIVYREYPWTHEYTAQAWVDLLTTQSDHIVLERQTQDRLLEAIANAIDSHGGTVVIEYSTVLVVARRKEGIGPVLLRTVVEADLAVFFEHRRDPVANRMAAFTAKDPNDRAAFSEHWQKLLADESVILRTILWQGQVAGHIGSFLMQGKREVMYWIGREFWGKGIATDALSQFLRQVTERPLYAGAASDNLGSIRVLEKCGFQLCGNGRGFSNARGQETDEVLLVLPPAAEA